MKTPKAIFAIVICLSVAICDSYAQQWQVDLVNYFERVRTGDSMPAIELSSVDSYTVLNFLKPFARDSNGDVRIKACEMASLRAHASKDPDVRKAGVDILTSACTQADPKVTGVTLNFMKTFLSGDFSPVAKENIRSLLVPDHPHLKEIMKMAAFLRLHDVTPHLKIFAGPESRPANRWAAIISLARLGDKDAADEMMTRIRRLPVNDDVVYNLFPDLIFSRHPDAISYLVETLYSDKKNCLSPDAEREATIPCAYRVMEQLAPVIKGFPLTLEEGGDVKTTDYSQALQIVRSWLRENSGYELITETY